MEKIDVGQELLNVPMGEMVKSVALGIAEGQWALDKASMTVAELMSGQRLLRDLDTGKLIGQDNKDLPPGRDPVVIDSRVYFGYNYTREPDPADPKKSIIKRNPQKLSMMELGFTPVFYQFVDTIIEVKISITVTGTTEEAKDEKTKTDTHTNSYEHAGNYSWWRWGGYHGRSQHKTEARTSTVDAKFSNKYSYSIEGSSLLRTKLVPIPPPSILEDRIRQVMEDGEIWRDWLFAGVISADGTVQKSRDTVDTEVRNIPKFTTDSKYERAIPLKTDLTLDQFTRMAEGWTVNFLRSGNSYTVTSKSGNKDDAVLGVDDPLEVEDRMPGRPIAIRPPALKRELPG